MKARTEELRAESGTVTYSDPLTSFLYQILRDHMPAGQVEAIVNDIVEESGQEITFTNGWLAKYANNLAETLRNAETVNLKNSLNKVWEEVEKPAPPKPKLKQAVKDEIEDGDLAAVKALIDGAEEEGPDENVLASLEESKAALQAMISRGQISAQEVDDIKTEISDLLGEESSTPTEEVATAEETDGRSTEPKEQEVAGE